MEDSLVLILESFGFPVRRQGSFAANEAYPDTFFTFWSPDESEHSAYDNDTEIVGYQFQVNVYSTSPARAYSLLSSARVALKAEGWIIGTRGYDAASDEPTHTGRGMIVYYLSTEH